VRGLLVYVHYKSTRPLHAVVRPPVLCHILLCRVVHGMHKLRTDAWKFRQIFKRVGSPESTTINKGHPHKKALGTHLLCSASRPPQHATVRGAAFPRLRAAGKEENRVIFKPKGRPCPHGPCECQRGLPCTPTICILSTSNGFPESSIRSSLPPCRCCPAARWRKRARCNAGQHYNWHHSVEREKRSC
jgi:hypothetical protein